MTSAKGYAAGRFNEDPAVRLMLAAHVHCGEPMDLIESAELPLWAAAPEVATASFAERGPEIVSYRCACGFTLDQEPDLPI